MSFLVGVNEDKSKRWVQYNDIIVGHMPYNVKISYKKNITKTKLTICAFNKDTCEKYIQRFSGETLDRLVVSTIGYHIVKTFHDIDTEILFFYLSSIFRGYLAIFLR